MRLKWKKKTAERKGQSIIEYILLMAAVIALLLIFLRQGGLFEQAYDDVIQKQGDDMLREAEAIFN